MTTSDFGSYDALMILTSKLVALPLLGMLPLLTGCNINAPVNVPVNAPITNDVHDNTVNTYIGGATPAPTAPSIPSGTDSYVAPPDAWSQDSVDTPPPIDTGAIGN